MKINKKAIVIVGIFIAIASVVSSLILLPKILTNEIPVESLESVVKQSTNQTNFTEQNSYIINDVCDLNLADGVMTDTSCLQFKTETNGVITINDERYLAFALKGILNGNELIRTSMDFSWTWHIEQIGEDYIFWAENDNPNFIWRQYYYFYGDPSKPMKIKHYLKNNLNDITDMQMYYLTNVLPTDEIEYNETSYLVNDYMGLHKQGDFNDLTSTINFNAMYDFNFEDLVSDGFTINEFYIGSGSVIGKSNVNITAIGFTKNNGNFPKGMNVTIDPTFSTSDVESLSAAPMDVDKFIVAWCDESSNNVEAKIYWTNDTQWGGQITVDAVGGCDLDDGVVSVTALNTSAWVVAYFDDGVDDAFFSTYINHTSIVSAQQVDDNIGTAGRVDIDGIDGSDFWYGYYDDDAVSIFYAKYNFEGTELTAPTLFGGQNDESGADSIAIATLNSTHFVIAWDDADANEMKFGILGISDEVVVESMLNSLSVSLATFNSTHFVLSYFQQGNDDMVYATYDLITPISGIQTTDSTGPAAATTASEDVAIINSTHFVQIWHDDASNDGKSSVQHVEGNVVAGNTFISNPTKVIPSVAVISEEYPVDIGICGDNLIAISVQASNVAEYGKFYSNGTAWSGVCPDQPDFGTPTINETTIFPGMSINHTVSMLDNPSLYLFSWNASGAGCDTWENSSWITTAGDITGFNSSLISSACADKTIGYKFYANNTFGMANSLTETYLVNSYGILNVELITPIDFFNVTQNDTFEFNTTITCGGGAYALCGVASAYLRYNESALTPDTDVSIVEGDKPFYISGGGSSFLIMNYVGLDTTTVDRNNSITEDFGNNQLPSLTNIDCGVSGADADYDNIEARDNNRWDSSFGVSDYYAYSSFCFNMTSIGIDYDKFDSLNVSWEGYGNDGTTGYEATLFIYNISGSSWINADTHTSSTDDNLTWFNNTDVSSFIETGAGEFNNIFLVSVRSILSVDDAILMTDYVQTEVGFSSPQSPITSDILSFGETFTANWTINATGHNSSWEVGAFINSSYGNLLVLNNFTSNSTVCIGACAVGEPPADTCTYTSGDWNVDCSDNCTVTTAVTMDGSNLTLHSTEAGEFNLRNFVNNTDYIINFNPDICKINVYLGGGFA